MINEFNKEDMLLVDSYHINKNIEFISKIVSLVPMVSTFEKIAFRNYIAHVEVHEPFLNALYNILNDLNENSFDDFVTVLSLYKNEKNCNAAKWPVVTFFLAYFDSNNDIFIKPTTTKKLANILGYDIKYMALPNFETYSLVKGMIMDYKKISNICSKSNNITVQAVMYCAVTMGDNV